MLISEGQTGDRQIFWEICRKFELSYEGSAHHNYESKVKWNTEAISENCVTWLNNNEFIASYSQSWLFASFKTERLLSGLLDRTMCQSLRLLMQVLSINHNWYQDVVFSDCSATKLSAACAFAGSQTLQGLEVALRPVNLSQKSLDQLRGLFLMLFGAILAISYSDVRVEPAQVSNVAPFEHTNETFGHQQHGAFSFGHQTNFAAAKEQLLRVLIYHMANLAERTLGTRPWIPKDSLLHQACDRWGSKGFLDWTIDPHKVAPTTELPVLNEEATESQTSKDDFFTSKPSLSASDSSMDCQLNAATRFTDISCTDAGKDPFASTSVNYSTLGFNEHQNFASYSPTFDNDEYLYAGALFALPGADISNSPRSWNRDLTRPVESGSVYKPYSGPDHYPGGRAIDPQQQLENAQKIYDSIPTFQSVDYVSRNSDRLLHPHPEMAPLTPSFERKEQRERCPICNSNLDSSGFCETCAQELCDFNWN